MTRPHVQEQLWAGIGLEGIDDLPTMIEVVREAELACSNEIANLGQFRSTENSGQSTPTMMRLNTIVRSEACEFWDGRNRWLQNVRIYLERELERERARATSLSGI